ncbi:MAG: hypothetical protein MUF10_01015 [Thermoanaerobaculaceae bacterium]|jgi:tetratricopeptide (TPR) repeat protein|nr:hypothetical protein [Thermoanaerobaculaceae bacterium]
MAGVAVALAVLLGGPGPDLLWYQSYEQGVAAVEEGRGASAIPLLEAALARRPVEALQVRTHGVHLVDYLPNLYLAYAHWLAGDSHRARLYLSRTEQDGVAAGSEAGAAMLDALRAMLREPAPVPPAAVATASEPARFRLFPPQPPVLSEGEYQRLRAEVMSSCGIDPSSPLGFAPWYFHYELAQALDRRGDPQRALEALLVATEHRPASRRQARMYGLRFTDYLPYFWIAREHTQLGNWECALDALEMSERTGEVGEGDPEYLEYRAMVTETRRRLNR